MGIIMSDVLIQACQEEAAGSVAEILQFFLEECEIDQAPTYAEIEQCRDILKQRGGKFERLAKMCQQWLDEETPA